MKKIILLSILMLFTLLQARMVDGIAMIVEGEAVTTAEIRALQQQRGVSKKQAVDILIVNRLQEAAMKDIVVGNNEVDTKITAIAKQNHLTIPKMQKILKQQGTTWSKYRSSIQTSIKKEKFYKEKILSSIPVPSDDELKIFYQKHKKDFTIPSVIHTIEYSSKNEEKMKKFSKTHNKKGIKAISISKKTKSMNPALLSMLLQTANGAYTATFNAGEKYVVYKVRSKRGKVGMPFEAAKPAVLNAWRQQQQGKALKDYFEKLRVNADIQKLR